ncbi:MAG: hypothetical protein AAGD25_13895, partial [Cyanobacteria bacterium P01_F01_bin.150]
ACRKFGICGSCSDSQHALDSPAQIDGRRAKVDTLKKCIGSSKRGYNWMITANDSMVCKL